MPDPRIEAERERLGFSPLNAQVERAWDDDPYVVALVERLQREHPEYAEELSDFADAICEDCPLSMRHGRYFAANTLAWYRHQIVGWKAIAETIAREYEALMSRVHESPVVTSAHAETA